MVCSNFTLESDNKHQMRAKISLLYSREKVEGIEISVFYLLSHVKSTIT